MLRVGRSCQRESTDCKRRRISVTTASTAPENDCTPRCSSCGSKMVSRYISIASIVANLSGGSSALWRREERKA